MKLLKIIMNPIITFALFINKYTLHLYLKEKFNELKRLVISPPCQVFVQLLTVKSK